MFRTPVLIKDRLIASPLYHQDRHPKPDTEMQIKPFNDDETRRP